MKKKHSRNLNGRDGIAAIRKLQFQPLEAREVLAASLGWDGAGLGSANLTYHIANYPSTLTPAQTTQAIETALAAWSSVADIRFTPTNTPGLPNSLDFSFTNIDGPARTLAQAYFPADVNSPRLAGDVQFDIAENWEIGNALGRQAFDLIYVAVHEIGHALGLDHATSSSVVMSASASPMDTFTGLKADDISAILNLYAPAVGSSAGSNGSSNGSDQADSGNSGSGTNDSPPPKPTRDPDSTPFPKKRWKHGGDWRHFGSRFGAGENSFFNIYLPTDVNGDWRVTATDALLIINFLNFGTRMNSVDPDLVGLIDCNGDGKVTASDALTIINVLNDRENSTLFITRPIAQQQAISTVDRDAANPKESISQVAGSDNSNTPISNSDDDNSSPDCNKQAADTELILAVAGRNRAPESNELLATARLAFSDAQKWITRFDVDNSSGLIQSEVPEKLWQLLVDAGADTDESDSVSNEELQTVITAARQTLFNRKDASQDGQIDAIEAGERAWRKLSQADTDDNDQISFDEFSTWISERVAAGPQPRPGDDRPGNGRGDDRLKGGLWHLSVDRVMSRFDANADGALSASELPDKLVRFFTDQGVDADNDGTVSADELRAAVVAARTTKFNQADTNADGQLTSDEVGERRWRVLQSADIDANSSISLEEFQAWTPEKPASGRSSSNDTANVNNSIGKSQRAQARR